MGSFIRADGKTGETRPVEPEYPYTVISIIDGKEAVQQRIEQKPKFVDSDATRCDCDSLAAATTEASLRDDTGEWEQDEIIVLPNGVALTNETLAAAVRPRESVDLWAKRDDQMVKVGHYRSLDAVEAAIDDHEIGDEPLWALRAYLPWTEAAALPL